MLARRLARTIKVSVRRFASALPLRLARWLLYVVNFKRLPRVNRPDTFHEKLHRRILLDRNPRLVMACSKVESKDFVRQVAPDVAIPETIWHGSDVHELVQLEVNGPWVLKASHRSGLVVFGEGAISEATLPDSIQMWLDDAEWRNNKLWGYRQARKELVLERRIGDGSASLPDYKFFVFDGRVEMIQVDHNRRNEPTRVLYDGNWNPLPWVYTWRRGDPTPAPRSLPMMLSAASRIGSKFDFARVDLYTYLDRVYFGEITVYPGAGLSHWPRELDYWLGRHWILRV